MSRRDADEAPLARWNARNPYRGKQDNSLDNYDNYSGSEMAKLFASFLILIWFAPVWIATLGTLIHVRLSRRRWIVHVAVLAAMLFAPISAVYLQGIVDPTTIQNPGPGDGLALLLYLPEMVLSFLIYAVIAIAIRRANRPVLR